MAYKLGFRWRPVCSAVPTTTTALDTPWSTFPIYTPVPSDPYTPTGSGLDDETWTTPDEPTALPWSSAPVPALPTTIPRPYWRYDRSLDLRRVQAQPSISRPKSRPTQPGTPAAPTAPATASSVLTVAPVRTRGVPGSSHDGVDTVSVVNNK